MIQILKVKARTETYFECCSGSNLEKFHVYDGPGILSHQVHYDKSDNFIIYEASTFQLFVEKTIKSGKKICCYLQYEGESQLTESIYIDTDNQNTPLAFQWTSEHKSFSSNCNKAIQITTCKLHLKAKQSIQINITNLSGSSYASFDSHFTFHHTYKDPIGLCRYGMLSVVHRSKYNQEKYTTPLCRIKINCKHGLWLSSESILDVMFFVYSPYSNMEVEFHVTSSDCTSVTINLCKETEISQVELPNTDAIDISNVERTLVEESRYLNGYNIYVKKENVCLWLNLIANRTKECHSYTFVLHSMHSVTASGYLNLGYYYSGHSYKLYFEQNQERIYFDKNSDHYFNTPQNPSVFKIYIFPYRMKILHMMLALQIKSSLHLGRMLNNDVCLSIRSIEVIPNLISGTVSICYKLQFPTMEKVFSTRIKTVFSRDIHIKSGKTLETCVLLDALQSCVKQLAVKNIKKNVFHDVRKANVFVTKNVKVTKHSLVLYIDSNTVLQGKSKMYQMVMNLSSTDNPLVQQGRSPKLVGPIVQLEIIKPICLI